MKIILFIKVTGCILCPQPYVRTFDTMQDCMTTQSLMLEQERGALSIKSACMPENVWAKMKKLKEYQ